MPALRSNRLNENGAGAQYTRARTDSPERRSLRTPPSARGRGGTQELDNLEDRFSRRDTADGISLARERAAS